MALTGLLRSKLSNLVVTSCTKQAVVKTSLPTLTSACENYETRKGVNYIQCRGRKRVHIPHLKPIDFRSGDLELFTPPQEDEYLYKYRHIQGLDKYPGDLKKLFTVAYATENEKLEHMHMKVQEKLSDETGPGLNYEKMIAHLTIKIRHMMVLAEKNRQNKGLKHYTFQRIGKRNKLLNYLKRLDIDQYNKLIKELNIDHLTDRTVEKVSKRQTQINKVVDEVEEKKRKKREALEKMFSEEKEKFLEYKRQVLEEISEEATQTGIDLKEVVDTFTKEQQKKQEALQAKPVKMGRMFVKWYEEEKIRKEKQLKIIPDPYVLGLKKH